MLTSKDLLSKALDYDGFWDTSKRIKDSKPSQARQLQLNKLFEAFNISKKNVKSQTHPPRNVSVGYEVATVYAVSGRSKSMNRPEYIKTLTDFKYFSSGEFLADADSEKYKAIKRQTAIKAKQIFPEHSKVIDSEPVNLVHLFSNLYNFRLSIYHMFKYNFDTKMQEQFSVEDDYCLYLRKEFMKSMNSKLSDVDKILCNLIDPARRKFEEAEIGYPSYDFTLLDQEWENRLRT